jgi:hypothetical protein
MNAEELILLGGVDQARILEFPAKREGCAAQSKSEEYDDRHSLTICNRSIGHQLPFTSIQTNNYDGEGRGRPGTLLLVHKSVDKPNRMTE